MTLISLGLPPQPGDILRLVWRKTGLADSIARPDVIRTSTEANATLVLLRPLECAAVRRSLYGRPPPPGRQPPILSSAQLSVNSGATIQRSRYSPALIDLEP